MKDYQSLCHTKQDCKYHVVFIPKRQKKLIFGAMPKASWRDTAGVGGTKGMPDSGRAFDGRSCAHLH